MHEHYTESSNYAKFYEEAKNVVSEAFEDVGFDTTSDAIYEGCKWALAMSCNERSSLPTGFNNTVMDKCKEVLKFETVDFFSYNETLKGVAVAPLMNHIFKYSDKGVGGRAGSKVAVESARYDVLASLATFLGRKEVIPIGSMIAIEIWQDKTAQPLPPQYIIRFVLNGNEVLLEETADKFRFDTLPAIDGFCPYQNVYNY